MSHSRLKLLALPLIALVLISCTFTAPLRTSTGSPTPDLVQTLTALSTAQPVLAATETQAPATALPSASETSAPTATSTNTTVPPTATATATASGGVPVVQITPITGQPTAIVIVPNPNPNPNPVPSNLVRINFAPNATHAGLSGNINGGTMIEYVLRAGVGQVMIVNADSAGQNVRMAIYGLTSGQVLLSSAANLSSWQGLLPATQDYVIRLIATGGNTSYSLSVTIPEIIAFQPGAISASRSYPITGRDVHTFILRAVAGQTMTLTLTPTDQTLLLAFYGYQDGQPYLRTAMGLTTWSGPVPATQDYIVQVFSMVDANSNFTLDVKIQ